MHASDLSPLGRTYVAAVIASGLAVVGLCVVQLYLHPVPYQWFLLAALTLLSGSATVQLPSSHASISISEVFVFIAILLYGPAAGTIVVALDGLVISFWMAKRRPEWYRALFNMSAPAVAAWCSAQLFFLTSGLVPLAQRAATLNQILPFVMLSAITYFCLNTWFITFAVTLEKRYLNPFKLWFSSFAWLSLTYVGGASVAVIVAVYNRNLDFGFFGVIIPLLLVMYFTFRTTMGRLEDADKHLGQLNTLYLSTIETLAMAIDAKDQVTHGHIRRVQNHAVFLAKRVGVTDPQQIRAIEAAALLHDTGKLAVPEYILNKPGKLTPAEFEKMKLHASVGADILSAIAFPYPVVPIVRHHHENWDGSGYPSGIAGTEIPIGARILAVVDCFDALTSDRPYRPRLSDEEALSILRERRGSMYDPLIVDTFALIHNEIHLEPTTGLPPAISLVRTARATFEISSPTNSPSLDAIAASADEMLTLYDLARALAGQVSISDASEVIATHLRRLIPSSLCIFFMYDTATDDLEAAHAFGEASSMVKGMRIPLGQRLSGWVAANRQTIINSDAFLDLGEVARTSPSRLRSCLSTPFLSGDQLLGVLTLYSHIEDGFNDDHQRIAEAIAKQIGHTFRSTTDVHPSNRRDPLTGLPDVSQLEHVVGANHPGQDGLVEFALLLIDVVDLKAINTAHGREAGDEALRHIVRQTRRSLRIGDILFRYRSDEFVVFLSGANSETAGRLASSIRDQISSQALPLKNQSPLTIEATVTVTSAPDDGGSLTELIATARSRMVGTSGAPERRVH